MKICVAQTRPVKGNIQQNIANHKMLIDLAASNGADTVIFPELSLTGYEPELAKTLATHQDDRRFDDFQKISDAKKITIGVGVPINNESGISISMILFQPQKARQTYSKKYIHADEEPYFVSAENFNSLLSNKAALAICYELSVPQHSADAYKSGAEIYIASVAKTARGVEKAYNSLAGIAKKYSMMVFMSNCVGPCDNFESAGGSAIWNNNGVLLGQLDDKTEGILILDLETQKLVEITV